MIFFCYVSSSVGHVSYCLVSCINNISGWLYIWFSFPCSVLGFFSLLIQCFGYLLGWAWDQNTIECPNVVIKFMIHLIPYGC